MTDEIEENEKKDRSDYFMAHPDDFVFKKKASKKRRKL